MNNRRKRSLERAVASKKAIRDWKEDLKNLGFHSYADYLESDLWESIRGKVLARDGFLCVSCGSEAENVHHRNYGPFVMRGNDYEPLVSLCRRCHYTVEFAQNGRKRTLYAAKIKLRELLRRARKMGVGG